jgi:hypothetical protein
MKLLTISTLAGVGLIAVFSLTGCSTSEIAKAQSAITTVSTDAAKLSADEPAAIAAVTAVTGSSSTVTSAASYVSTIAADAQTLAPLLSAALSMFTTADTSGHRHWNAAGYAALHRYHISPSDPKALAKLETHMRAKALSGGENHDKALSRDAIIGCKDPSISSVLRNRRAAQNSLASL